MASRVLSLAAALLLAANLSDAMFLPHGGKVRVGDVVYIPEHLQYLPHGGKVRVGDVVSPAEHLQFLPQGGKVRVGDVVYTAEQRHAFTSRKMADKSYFWPKDSSGKLVIDYFIADPKVDKNNVAGALKTWQDGTCIEFNELSAAPSDKAYIHFMTGDGCQADLGYVEATARNASLSGHACDMIGVMHEVGHLLGFQHEHSRADRDPHIIIVLANVAKNDYVQFDKEKTNNYSVPYDYLSAMHYDEKAASSGDGRVMLTTDPRFQNLIGEGKTLSFMDYKLFNIAYDCIGDWEKSCNTKSSACLNQGYLGKNCKCACPMGTTGPNCENLKMSYNDALIAKYAPFTAKFTNPGASITSPGHPTPYSDAIKMTQVLEAPPCHKAVLTFNSFDIEGTDQDSGKCVFDSLEIRDEIASPLGKIFCGTAIASGTKFESKKSTLVLHYTGYNYKSEGSTNPHAGYTATFTTEPISGC